MPWPKGVKRGPRKPKDESLPPEAQALVDEVIAQTAVTKAAINENLYAKSGTGMWEDSPNQGVERPMQQEAPKRTFSQPQSKWGRASGGMKAGDWGDTASDFNPSEENVDMFHIAPEDLPGDGKYAFEWCPTAILGKDEPRFLAAKEAAHWRVVHSGDFDGWGEGRFDCKKGQDVPITRENLVLVARPKEYSDKARKEDMRRAQEQANLKTGSLLSGQMPGVTGASHKSALNANKISKSWERVAVPSDE